MSQGTRVVALALAAVLALGAAACQGDEPMDDSEEEQMGEQMDENMDGEMDDGMDDEG